MKCNATLTWQSETHKSQLRILLHLPPGIQNSAEMKKLKGLQENKRPHRALKIHIQLLGGYHITSEKNVSIN